MRRRSPQEKKRLSYAKDRRNNYGENNKSSRKNIVRNKKAPHRANRHRDHQQLVAARGPLDEALAAAAESRLESVPPKLWRKWPDLPLGAHIEAVLRRRTFRQNADTGSAQTRIQRIRRQRRLPESS